MKLPAGNVKEHDLDMYIRLKKNSRGCDPAIHEYIQKII